MTQMANVMNELDFYGAAGPMTDLGAVEPAALVGVSADPAAVAAVVQGVVVHPFWAATYGIEVTPEHEGDVQIRSAARMIERILATDERPLVEAREPGDRFVGNCRHFSTLTTALLRRASIPSRARCGFGGYFEPGKWIDHWIVEYWDGGRWVSFDAQIDELQRGILGLADDPADLPPGRFLTAGDAWRRCQAGEEDGDRFGILDMWGQWFIAGNVARDLAALNKVEMLPWDGWGALAVEAPANPAVVDEVAALTVSGDLRAIRDRYETDADLRVPARVRNLANPDGPITVDVPELA